MDSLKWRLITLETVDMKRLGETPLQLLVDTNVLYGHLKMSHESFFLLSNTAVSKSPKRLDITQKLAVLTKRKR